MGTEGKNYEIEEFLESVSWQWICHNDDYEADFYFTGDYHYNWAIEGWVLEAVNIDNEKFYKPWSQIKENAEDYYLKDNGDLLINFTEDHYDNDEEDDLYDELNDDLHMYSNDEMAICTKEDAEKWYNFTGTERLKSDDSFLVKKKTLEKVKEKFYSTHDFSISGTSAHLEFSELPDFKTVAYSDPVTLNLISKCNHEYEEKQLFTSKYYVCKKCGKEK